MLALLHIRTKYIQHHTHTLSRASNTHACTHKHTHKRAYKHSHTHAHPFTLTHSFRLNRNKEKEQLNANNLECVRVADLALLYISCARALLVRLCVCVCMFSAVGGAGNNREQLSAFLICLPACPPGACAIPGNQVFSAAPRYTKSTQPA